MSAIANGANIVFWGVITFSILVVLHEGGHFLAAKAFKVKVHEFMIGLPGPALRVRSKRSGTAFGVTIIPLGGYVRIAGMEPGPEDPLLGPVLAAVTRARRTNALELSTGLNASASQIETALVTLADWGAIAPAEDDGDSYVALMDESLADDPDELLAQARAVTYRGLPTLKRIALLSAGVAVNLAMAIAVFTFVITVFGYYQPSLTIEKTVSDGAAAAAGLRAGDRIVAVDGETLRDWGKFTAVVSQHEPGDDIEVRFMRDQTERSVVAVLGAREDGTAVLGVQSEIEFVRPGVVGAFVDSLKWTGVVFQAVADLFRPSTFRQTLAGAMSVVGISVEVARVVRNGPLDYAWLVAFLSLSLGVMNLLPIPPLDGGKVMLEVIERIAGRPLPRKLAYGLNAAGMILLLTLVGYLIYADVMRLAGHSISG